MPIRYRNGTFVSTGGRTLRGKRASKRMMVLPAWAKKARASRSIANFVNRTYKFKRTVVIQGALQSGTNTGLPGGGTVALSFSLGQVNMSRSIQGGAAANSNIAVPGVSEMTALFQQWKIDKVVVKIIPTRNSADIVDAIPVVPGYPTFPTLLTVIDYDDNDAPTTIAPLQEHGDCSIKMLDRIHSQTVKPKFTGVVTGAPGTTVAGPPMRGFLDCAQPNIEHNSVKFGFIAEQARFADLYVDIYYTMRGSK